MNTPKRITAIKTNTSEIERLELIEKKVEIQRKKIEIKKENQELEENMLRRYIAHEEKKAVLQQISEIRNLLSEWTIDSDRTILASEPFLKAAIDGERREFLLNKLMHLINRI